MYEMIQLDQKIGNPGSHMIGNLGNPGKMYPDEMMDEMKQLEKIEKKDHVF